MQTKFKISQKKSLSCHPHELSFTNSSQRKYFGITQCHVCRKNNLEFSWHCSQCKYGMCEVCSSQQEQKKQNDEKIFNYKNSIMNGQNRSLSLHHHKLKLTSSQQRQYTGITGCDACQKNQIEYSWHCSQCQFDIYQN
ncbi:hypothetical protein ABPG72_021071 [Tetrahymena utriculariae]